MIRIVSYGKECIRLTISIDWGKIKYYEFTLSQKGFEQMEITNTLLLMAIGIPGIIAATKNDKKMEAGVIKFILLDRVGHAYIDRTVTEEEMEQALSSIM